MKKKQTEWIKTENLIKENAINIMIVHHDDWCDFLNNKSENCNCDTDISVDVKEKDES